MKKLLFILFLGSVAYGQSPTSLVSYKKLYSVADSLGSVILHVGDTLGIFASLRDRSTHTGVQPATSITQDGTHRFVTDIEKNVYALKIGPGDTALMLLAYRDWINNKVDKVAGKALSKNDFTDALLTKLTGIATGATANSTDAQLRDRATHTGTQGPTTITNDATHRWSTDAEKADWNDDVEQSALNDTASDLRAAIAAGGVTVDAVPTDGSANPVSSNGTFDALTLKQAQLNGTGFVKASGTTITYDNTTYTPDNNTVIGATKTKITYDNKGRVTGGADATTSDIAEGANQYFTNTRARNALSAAASSPLTYNSSTGVFTYDSAQDHGPIWNALLSRLRLTDLTDSLNIIRSSIGASADSGSYVKKIDTVRFQQRGQTGSKGLILGNSESASYLGRMRLDSLLLTAIDTLTGNTITNLAVAGNTINQQRAAFVANANKSTYNWILLHVGLNDIWDYTEASSLKIARYQALVDTIRFYNPTAIIIAAAMQPVDYVAVQGSTNGATNYASWLALNNAIMGIGSSRITGVNYRIDRHSTALNDGTGKLSAFYSAGDFIHTNNIGGILVANVFRDAINQAGFLTVRTAQQVDQFWNYNAGAIFAKSGVVSVGTSSAGSLTVGALPSYSKFQVFDSSGGSGHISEWINGVDFSTSGITTGSAFTTTWKQGGSAGHNLIFGYPYIQSKGTGRQMLFDFGTSTAINASGSLTRRLSLADSGQIYGNAVGNDTLIAKNTTIVIGRAGAASSAFDISTSGNDFFNTYSVRGTSTLTSGIFSAGATYPTINQSGSAAYVGNFMSIREQALGSGQSYFARWGTNTLDNALGTHTDLWTVTNTGKQSIGSGPLHPSAALEINSTTQGVLIPRMTTTQRNAISSPATGLMIFNTTINRCNWYNGSTWDTVSIGSTDTTNLSHRIDSSATAIANKESAITGTTSADYFTGAKTFVNFNTAARAAITLTTVTPIGQDSSATYTSGVLNIPKYVTPKRLTDSTQVLRDTASQLRTSIITNSTAIASLPRRVLYVTTAKSWTGNTSETEVYRDTIKAAINPFGANTSLHIPFLVSATSNTNTKTFRLKINGTTVSQLTLNATTTALSRWYFWMSNRNSTSSQIVGGATNQSTNTGFGFINTGSPQTYSLTTSGDVIITVTVQLNTGTDAVALEQMDVIMYP